MNRLSIVAALAYASQSARRRNIALGIVGLFLLGVVFAVARATLYPERRTSSNGAAPSPAAALDPSQPVEPVVQAVHAFSAFTLEQSATRGSDSNDTYASDGLRLLATVVDALIVRDSLVRDIHVAALEQMRAEADRLERSAAGSTRAMTTTRAAFVSAAAVVTAVQRWKYPHLEQATTRLRDAARSIRLNRPLGQQSAEVEVFFQRASDAVQGMAAVQL